MSQLIPLISLSGMSSTQITATPEALNQRTALAKLAGMVVKVSNADEAKTAAEVLRNLKTFTRGVEDSRTTVKEPVLVLGRKIDGLAKELTNELGKEEDRISRLLGAHQAEQLRLEQEDRRKREEAARRIREEAERKEREAQERARKEAEALAAKEAEVEDDAEAERLAEQAKADTQRAIAEQEARERERDQQLAAAWPQPAVMTAPRPSGITTVQEIVFEVEDVRALYRAYPDLVKLTPNVAAIKAALKLLPAGSGLPGVRHRTEAKSVVR